MRIVLFLLSLCIASPAWSYQIFVDAGHGGEDRGAVRGKIQEADVVLEISKLLVAELRSRKIKVSMSRTDNTFKSLTDRALSALSNGADLFVSVHANSSPDVRAKGGEVYFQSQLEIEDESKMLAHEELKDELGSGKRDLPNPLLDSLHLNGVPKVIAGDLMRSQRFFLSSELAKNMAKTWGGHHHLQASMVRQGPFYLINQSPIPSVLVEVGYLSHPEEGPMLTQRAFQKQIAAGLAKGIQDFLARYGSLLKTQSLTNP